jgi:hypothetical protein
MIVNSTTSFYFKDILKIMITMFVITVIHNIIALNYIYNPTFSLSFYICSLNWNQFLYKYTFPAQEFCVVIFIPNTSARPNSRIYTAIKNTTPAEGGPNRRNPLSLKKITTEKKKAP